MPNSVRAVRAPVVVAGDATAADAVDAGAGESLAVAGADGDRAAVRIAGLDDLIAMKKAAGRPKDRIYVEELEAIKRLGGS